MRHPALRWLAAGLVATVLLWAMPYFAAVVVRAAIESQSAAERASYATGGSPWSWRFRRPDDVVAGRAFGSGTLQASPGGLTLKAGRAGTAELGLPLPRPVDLTRLDTLQWHASASAPGQYGIVVRESLDGPLLQASLGTLPPAGLSRAIDLRALAWADADGSRVAPPARAAMLRLQASLPPGATLEFDSAALLPGNGVLTPRTASLPNDLSAEQLLAWRDRQRDRDPLLTFGAASGPEGVTPWSAWLTPVIYILMLGVFAARKRAAPASDLLDAVLVLVGPLWFIAGMGLSTSPSPSGVAMFAAGVVYALFLAVRRSLPGWQGLGAWRYAGWPLLAIPAAFVLVHVFGHAPQWPPAGRIAIYLGWALFQQWLVLAVAGALLARALPRPAAVLLTALAFALLHTPNGLLMQLCFVAELGWAWWYFRHRALLPVAIAHAASAVVLQAGLAGGMLRSLEVSARFLQ
jgi:membrane protease YdiL (CAAX protease family)